MTLESSTALVTRERSFGELTLREAGHRAMVSVAFAPIDREAVDAHCRSVLGVSIPGIGQVSRAGDGLTLLGLQQDQIWCIVEHADSADENGVIEGLENLDRLYLTNQGDGWATLLLEGTKVCAVLERLCPLDLHTDSFPVDSVARTIMDHMATVIIRTGQHAFEIMTPRSFASSMLHAIENVALHLDHERQL